MYLQIILVQRAQISVAVQLVCGNTNVYGIWAHTKRILHITNFLPSQKNKKFWSYNNSPMEWTRWSQDTGWFLNQSTLILSFYIFNSFLNKIWMLKMPEAQLWINVEKVICAHWKEQIPSFNFLGSNLEYDRYLICLLQMDPSNDMGVFKYQVAANKIVDPNAHSRVLKSTILK